MSVEQEDVVDFVSFDHAGEVVLTISDHLEWDEANEHALALQKKLNCYLRFITSGELVESFPQAVNKRPIISVVALYHPTALGNEVLAKARQVIENAGIGFQFEQRHFNSP